MKSTETEEWRPVKDHPGYFVSSLGRVLGRSGKILKTWGVSDKRNYPTFFLILARRARMVWGLAAAMKAASSILTPT